MEGMFQRLINRRVRVGAENEVELDSVYFIAMIILTIAILLYRSFACF
jgi:hypothetical protein